MNRSADVPSGRVMMGSSSPRELFIVRADDIVSLRAGKCNCCGRISVPLELYGCSECGASPEEISEFATDGAGKLLGFATVFQKLTTEREIPFTVGKIKLDVGPIITAVMLENCVPRLEIGASVVPVIVTRESDMGAESASVVSEWQYQTKVIR